MENGCDVPFRQVRNTGASNLFAWIMPASVVMMPASMARCTRIFLRRMTSGKMALSSDFLPLCDVRRLVGGTGSCKTAGDKSGVEVPDMTSFRPLNPLWGRSFGGGRPLRKCSSSASVPLSLAGVDSLEKVGRPDSDGWLESLPSFGDASLSPRETRWSEG